MDFGRWDTLFNFLLLFFWYGMWTSRERQTFFNPFLSPLSRATDAVTRFLQPVFPGVPGRAVCGVAFVVLVIMRALAVPHNARWALTMGFEAGVANAGDVVSCLVFSVLSFACFLFSLWGLSLIYVHKRDVSSLDQTAGALHFLSRPFTRLQPAVRPWVLWAFGAVLASLVNVTGAASAAAQDGLVLRSAVSALAGWVQVLGIVQGLVILTILGSWLSMFTGSQGIMFPCRSWLDMLIGPLRRYPIRIGMLDLSPLVFLIGLGFLQMLLLALLQASYNVLL